MTSMTTPRHPTWTLSFSQRAQHPNTAPLAAYLLHLISIKKSNLCLSADVSTSAQLIKLAEDTGDSICLLKTHADIVTDWSDRTARLLREIAKAKGFLIFEDRKFGDIGSTVQRQYTSGPLSIAKWAEIVNAHIFPGPSIVTSLKQAAQDVISAYNSSVHTEISVGSPAQDSAHSDEGAIHLPSDTAAAAASGYTRRSSGGGGGGSDGDSGGGNGAHKADEMMLDEPDYETRKSSVVSITTTISARTEPISPQPTPMLDSLTEHDADKSDNRYILDRLGETPYLRALLLLAEMSSEGNLLTGAYTERCVEVARDHRDFVIGFVAQRSLNSEPDDNFLTFTPGVSLPPSAGPREKEGKKRTDGLGQQYNSPWRAVYEQGADVVIVGRGVIKADDPGVEAERYRVEAWRAYEERIGLGKK